MFDKNINKLIISVMFSLAGVTGAFAETKSCIPIGGVAIADFFSEGENKPMVISASLTGSVSTAAGKITAQRMTKTGMEMDMEHYFGKTDGGYMFTKDLGILTAVPGKPGRFMIEITYDIQPAVTRGSLKGYEGQFKSFGLVDLREPNTLKGLVRYSGEICKQS